MSQRMARAWRVGILSALTLWAWAAPARAQAVATCEVPSFDLNRTGVEERSRLLRIRQPFPVWIGDGREGNLTLRRLAQLASPALWFSPQEFLLVEDTNASRPPYAVPADLATPPAPGTSPTPTVYFRVRELRLKEDAFGQTLSLDAPGMKARVQNVDEPWDCGSTALPVRQLDRITIRYFFYYPEDRGVGGHFDDLEALEIQLRTRWTCGRAVDGGDKSAADAAARDVSVCFDSIVIESIAGSAHGVGWYTNVLEVSHTADTRVPLTVLVEENKHASSPDRDGDGIYMPHYDINRYTNDGWGVRDVAGSGKLGSPTYSAEQSRVIRALRPDNRALPKTGYWSPRLRAAFDAAEENTAAAGNKPSRGYQYELSPSWESKICTQGEVDEDVVRDKSKKTSPKDDGDKLAELAKKLHFCDTPADTRTLGSGWVTYQHVSDAFSVVYPGPRNQFGFMNWPQRMSLSLRNDDGNGLSYIGPFLPGAEMPLFGGWIVGRISYVPESTAFDLGRAAVWALYTPSASQSAAWYVAVGHEWRSYGTNGTDSTAHAPDHSKGMVEELGIKFRFSLEWMPLVKFWGARVGVRADGLRPITNPRLIFEFGAGSW